jgi:hypothetical protein
MLPVFITGPPVHCFVFSSSSMVMTTAALSLASSILRL